MRAITFTFILTLVACIALAQTPPPVNMQASTNLSGEVSLSWLAPFAPDYLEDFEDGQAQGWEFDNPSDWSVQDGYLRTGFNGGNWSSAYYAGETISEGIFEISVAREMGSVQYANSMILFSEDFYPEDQSAGFIFSVAPGNTSGNYQGSYFIARFVDDVLYSIASWRYTPVINNGHGVYNDLSVAVEGNTVVFYINGYEVDSYYDEMVPLSGYLGLSAAEQGGTFPHYGVVHFDYVGIDHADGAAPAAVGNIPEMPDLTTLLPEELWHAPADLAATASGSTVKPVVLGGFYNPDNGTDELDEFINYRIYRDGTFVGTADDESFTESLASHGLYDYTVTAMYDQGESMPDSAIAFFKNPAGVVINEGFENGLPNDWTIEAEIPGHTWHVDNGAELGLFDTPYMLVNDEASGGEDLNERIVTPELPVADAELVVLEFDSWFFQADFEFGHIQYQADGGEWTSVFLLNDNRPDSTHWQWDLTDELAGAETARIGFLYDDFMDYDGLYWGIDNVEVYVQGADNGGPVMLSVLPQTTVVPPNGGQVLYGVHLVSTLPNTVPGVQYWAEVQTPGGVTVGPLQVTHFTLQPFMDVSVQNIALNVPAGAPGGEYTVSGNVGFMAGPHVEDSFTFTKLGTVADGASGWSGSAVELEPTSIAAAGRGEAVPTEYALGEAYPNPFNPTTSISLTLPVAADVAVRVVNVEGRTVAELANGRMSAGSHTLTLDGSSLASGLYFVHATVPGQLNQVRKVTLLK